MQRKSANRSAAMTRSLSSMAMRGQVDGILSNALCGWVLDEADLSRPITVEFHIGGSAVGAVIADRLRGDLNGSEEDRRHGFEWPLPHAAPGADPIAQVRVFVANSDFELPGSPFAVDLSVTMIARGQIDVVDGLVVRGWAFDPATPTSRLSVVFQEDERTVAKFEANMYRGDLETAGIGDAHCAFEARLPIALADGHAHVLDVVLAESGQPLDGSPIRIAAAPTGVRALFSAIRGSSATDAARSAALDGLERVLALSERRLPNSVSFADYPAWRALFGKLNAGQLAADIEFLVVVEAKGDLVLAQRTLASLHGAGPARANVILLVNPEIWNAADAQQRSSLTGRVNVTVLSAITTRPADVLTRARGDTFVLWLEAGTRLSPFALAALAGQINQDVDLIYSDWEGVEDGQPMPALGPDWNYHYFLGIDYLGPVVAWRANGIAAAPEDDWQDLKLKAVELARPGSIKHYPRILGVSERSLHRGLPRAVLERHLSRIGRGAKLRAHPRSPEAWSVLWQARARDVVSIIIPTRDRVDLLKPCIESLLARTDYAALEIIVVDNGSRDPKTMRYLAALKKRSGVRVLRDDRAFNYSALNNLAVASAKGSILGFLNDDILLPPEVDPRWLKRIVDRLHGPAVEAVGIKLTYPSGLVQHSGVVVGVNGIAENAFKDLRGGEVGYGARAAVANEFSAATAAALFVSRAAFEAVGGFDPDHLPVAFNDVDLCLKMRTHGARIVVDPEITFIHFESASRGKTLSKDQVGRNAREANTMISRWGPVIDNDPHYNPSLNLDLLPFMGLAFPVRGWTNS